MSLKLGVGPRIKEFRDSRGLTRKEVADRMGVKPSTIQNIEDQKQKTSDAFILEFVDKFGVSVEWLFSKGEGGRLAVDLPDRDNPWSGDVRLDDRDFSLIRRFGVRASAGNGLYPDPDHQEDAIAFQTGWLLRQGINAQLAGIVEVSGDSMSPTLRDGALALVHLPEMDIRKEGIFAFTRDGEVFVKRISPLTFDTAGNVSSLVLISDNAIYPAEVMGGEDLNAIRIAGRIRCCIETF